MPLRLSTKVSPAGSASPPRVRSGDGKPVVVTVNVLSSPTLKVVVVRAGERGRLCHREREALRRARAHHVGGGEGDGVGAAGVGARRAAERPRAVAVIDERDTRRQRRAAARDGRRGKPLVVTSKLPAAPTVKVTLFALVTAGASLMVRVKACAALDPTTFVAVKVIA